MSSSFLRVSAETFSVTASVGDPTAGRTGARISAVHSDLKSTIVLLDDGYTQLAIVASPLPVEVTEMRAAIVATLAETLGLNAAQIFSISSHDHCVPNCVDDGLTYWSKKPGIVRPGTLNPLGRSFMAQLEASALRLKAKLTPVTIEWGKAEEKRVTFNRRGRRPDGKSYFIREEDRLLLDPSYIGEIDPEAMVVIFRDEAKAPVAALAFFTGHPVTAYNPEKMIMWGEWPQVACERLSAHLQGAPVAFLQGCTGNINSKYMLGGTVEQSRQLGEFLGESFIKAAQSTTPSQRNDLNRSVATVHIPLAPLPSVEALEKDLKEIDAFIQRGNANDPEALTCVGMNFPKALTPPYRAKLVDMVRPWFVSALEAHREGRAHLAPKTLPLEIMVFRLGDVGLVGMPFEVFVQTGLKIKREANLPCVLPCGYTNGAYGYIPDASAVADREYMAGFFRYTANRPPYASPAGDAAATEAVRLLAELSQ
jgi:hypothetical protein